MTEIICSSGHAIATDPVDARVKSDLGARMLGGVTAANGPALVIGTDCPALTTDHLRSGRRYSVSRRLKW